MRMLLSMALVLAACDAGGSVIYANVTAASVRVSAAQPSALADLRVSARFDVLPGHSDEISLHGGWLDGDSGAFVAPLALVLPTGTPIKLDSANSSAESDLVNDSVTNAAFTGLCDLQLNLGLTVSGVTNTTRSTSLGFPVRIDCL